MSEYRIIKYYIFGVSIQGEVNYKSIRQAQQFILLQVKRENIQVEGEEQWKLRIARAPDPLSFGGVLTFKFRGWKPGVFF